MSFATPAMTGNQIQVSNKPVFSNTSDVGFKPGMHYIRDPMSVATEHPNLVDSIPQIRVSIHPSSEMVHKENARMDEKQCETQTNNHMALNSLTVEENALNLTRQIQQMRRKSSQKQTQLIKGMDNHTNTFDLLVKEFISSNQPRFDQWMTMNQNRSRMPYIDAKEMYDKVRLDALHKSNTRTQSAKCDKSENNSIKKNSRENENSPLLQALNREVELQGHGIKESNKITSNKFSELSQKTNELEKVCNNLKMNQSHHETALTSFHSAIQNHENLLKSSYASNSKPGNTIKASTPVLLTYEDLKNWNDKAKEYF